MVDCKNTQRDTCILLGSLPMAFSIDVIFLFDCPPESYYPIFQKLNVCRILYNRQLGLDKPLQGNKSVFQICRIPSYYNHLFFELMTCWHSS